MIVDQINNEEIATFCHVGVGEIFQFDDESYIKINLGEAIGVGYGEYLAMNPEDKVKVATKVTIEY